MTAGDVGGIMGLLLGGSVLTIFELLDFVVFQLLETWLKKRERKKQLLANGSALCDKHEKWHNLTSS